MSEQISDGLMAYKKEEKVVVDKALLDTTHEDDEVVEPTEKTEPYQRTDWKKRYDDLRRYQTQQAQEFKDKQKELEKALSEARPMYTPPKTTEELAEFKKNNPDIYEVVETVAHLAPQNEIAELKEEIKSLQELRVKAQRETALAELKIMHPDFEEIRKDDTFKNWAKEQPQQIQDWLFKSLDPKLTSKAIKLFKSEYTQVPDKESKSSQKNESAADVVSTKPQVQQNSSGKKIWTQSEIARLSDRKFEELRDEINAAMMEGRILNK